MCTVSNDDEKIYLMEVALLEYIEKFGLPKKARVALLNSISKSDYEMKSDVLIRSSP